MTLDEWAKLQETKAVVWGQVVAKCSRQLEIIAVGGAKECFQTQTAPDGTPWPPLAHARPNGGNKPLQDLGLLKASLNAKTENGTLKLSASRPGADLHQRGGRIVAKGKKLSIPVSKEAKRAGGASKFPRKLFPIEGPKAVVLCERVGKKKKARLVVHYVLKDEVTVPKREFVGFSAAVLNRIGVLLMLAYEDHLLATLEGQRQAVFRANPLIGST